MAPFDFPKNLKEMSWEDKQRLHEQYSKYSSTASGADVSTKNVSELNPSKVVEPKDVAEEDLVEEPEQSEGYEAEPYWPTKGAYKFHPEKGYIVDDEDPWTLASLGRITNEEAATMAAAMGVLPKSRPVSEDDISAEESKEVRKKVAELPSATRDALERFGRL
jgi:hypothetical protein